MNVDNHQRRIFRLTVGVVLSSAVAIGFAWPLSYLAPMLVVSILGAADSAPEFKKTAALVLIIFLGLFSGVLFSRFFIAQPVLASLLLTIIFYWIYFYSNAGVLPNFPATMLIIGMTLIPLIAQLDPSIASDVAMKFLLAAIVAVIFSYISYFLFTHQSDEQKTSEPIPEIQKTKAHCHRIAGISTLIVMPAIIVFLTYNLVGAALVVMFIAILSLNPALEEGKKAGIGLLLGNALGGCVAIIFYNLMKMAPYYVFYLALMGLFILFMAQRVHSDKKSAVLWGMAISTFLILTGPIFTGAGDDAQEKFSTRLLQIGAAAVYIIMAFRLTANMWPDEERNENAKTVVSAAKV